MFALDTISRTSCLNTFQGPRRYELPRAILLRSATVHAVRNRSPRTRFLQHRTEGSMASGVAGYAKWSIAMITSIPIWIGGAGLLLLQFTKKYV